MTFDFKKQRKIIDQLSTGVTVEWLQLGNAASPVLAETIASSC